MRFLQLGLAIQDGQTWKKRCLSLPVFHGSGRLPSFHCQVAGIFIWSDVCSVLYPRFPYNLNRKWRQWCCDWQRLQPISTLHSSALTREKVTWWQSWGRPANQHCAMRVPLKNARSGFPLRGRQGCTSAPNGVRAFPLQIHYSSYEHVSTHPLPTEREGKKIHCILGPRHIFRMRTGKGHISCGLNCPKMLKKREQT